MLKRGPPWELILADPGESASWEGLLAEVAADSPEGAVGHGFTEGSRDAVERPFEE